MHEYGFQNSVDLFDHDKILNLRNLILAKMSVIHNSRNIVPAKLKCFTVIYKFYHRYCQWFDSLQKNLMAPLGEVGSHLSSFPM